MILNWVLRSDHPIWTSFIVSAVCLESTLIRKNLFIFSSFFSRITSGAWVFFKIKKVIVVYKILWWQSLLQLKAFQCLLQGMRRQWHSSFPQLSSLCCRVKHLFQSTPQLRTVVIPINIKSLTPAPAGATKLHSAAQQQPHMGTTLLVITRCLDVSTAPPKSRVCL